MTQPSPESESNSFKRLYKMSTTAGVGTHDYVAVNTPAVVTILAGLASLSVVVSMVMIVIPVFTIVTGAIALKQIGKSGGTQTGRGLAVAGILLAVLALSKVGFDEYSAARKFNESREAVAKIFDTFGRAIASQDYPAAYALFTPRFKQEVSMERFEGEFKQIEASPGYGRVGSVEWNQRLEAVADMSGTGRDMARAVVYLRFADPKAGRVEAEPRLNRNKGEEWLLDSFQPLFAQQAPPPGAGRPGAGAPQ